MSGTPGPKIWTRPTSIDQIRKLQDAKQKPFLIHFGDFSLYFVSLIIILLEDLVEDEGLFLICIEDIIKINFLFEKKSKFKNFKKHGFTKNRI